jgi:D-serine deaminase-like pyridoxal phosphate-dependent protein
MVLMENQNKEWYIIDNEDDVFSPALLVYPDRIEETIRRMIAIAGDTERLRPHVKTHKMPEMVCLQMKHGIRKFKCATIAEAEMVAGCGAPDILLAYQLTGPNIKRFFDLNAAYPKTKFSCIANSEEVIMQLSKTATARNMNINIWLDINVGMNRTGIVPGEEAERLARIITDTPKSSLEGLHFYDGHLTIDRYDVVSVVRDGSVTEQWNVEARRRKITI